MDIDPAAAAAGRYSQLRADYSEFVHDEPLKPAPDLEPVAAGLVWGEVDGNVTPKILLIALAPGHLQLSEPVRLEELATGLLAEQMEWPVYAHLVDDASAQRYALIGEFSASTQTIDEIPDLALIREHRRLRTDPTLKWSMHTYTRLMHRLDDFHEQSAPK